MAWIFQSTRSARMARGRLDVPLSIQLIATVLSTPITRCSPGKSPAASATARTAAISSVSAMMASSSSPVAPSVAPSAVSGSGTWIPTPQMKTPSPPSPEASDMTQCHGIETGGRMNSTPFHSRAKRRHQAASDRNPAERCAQWLSLRRRFSVLRISRMNVRPPGTTEHTNVIFPASRLRSRLLTALRATMRSSSSTISWMRSLETLMVMCSVSRMNPSSSTTRAGRKVLALDTGTPRSSQTCIQSSIWATASSYESQAPKKSST